MMAGSWKGMWLCSGEGEGREWGEGRKGNVRMGVEEQISSSTGGAKRRAKSRGERSSKTYRLLLQLPYPSPSPFPCFPFLLQLPAYPSKPEPGSLDLLRWRIPAAAWRKPSCSRLLRSIPAAVAVAAAAAEGFDGSSFLHLQAAGDEVAGAAVPEEET